MFFPITCSFISLYWVKKGQHISCDRLPDFLRSCAICVSSVGCIRPGREDTSTKPVPFYPLFQSAPSNFILSLLCASTISLSSPIILSWFIHTSPSSSVTYISLSSPPVIHNSWQARACLVVTLHPRWPTSTWARSLVHVGARARAKARVSAGGGLKPRWP